jgi:beta-glucosidase-like glycosyl hydrolase
MQDSPLGIRLSDYNSAFPAGGTVAASWDRDVWYERGYSMGMEHRGKGVDVQLGPVVGPLGRAPEGGRNWEGFSPDPVLSGIAVAQTVKGIQNAGVIACKSRPSHSSTHFTNSFLYHITHESHPTNTLIHIALRRIFEDSANFRSRHKALHWQ